MNEIDLLQMFILPALYSKHCLHHNSEGIGAGTVLDRFIVGVLGPYNILSDICMGTDF